MKIKNTNKVKALFISKNGYDSRIKQSELSLDEDGVFVDKYYKKNQQRAILITSINAYNIVKENNIDINFGELGENILIDFDLSNLQLGTKIKIGQVILEITQKCTICNSLLKIDKRVPKLLEFDRGVFAKALNEGLVKKGDMVEFID